MTPRSGAGEPAGPSALLLDLYQLTMAQSYYAEGVHERPATFSLFTRHLPQGWGYLVAAGLDDVLAYLEGFAFREDELGYLESTELFTPEFLAHLGGVRFTGDVRAMPEGTLFFPDEPVVEVTAPVLVAQLVETIVLNEIHFQSLIAGKAARCVDVARRRTLVDFGLRRTHRADAGMRVARSSYLAGFDSTSNVLAGRVYGMPIAGTMAHSYVESFADELAAFRAFARSYPDRSILLVDTYDTVEGVRRAALVAKELAAAGRHLRGVRLDSGDLLVLSRQARRILDEAGSDAIVFASGGLDERDVAALLEAGAPIDGFGIGSKLGTAADSPFLDMAYKLVEFDGRPVLKLSAAKATWPGTKQVWRLSAEGGYAVDVIGTAAEDGPEGGEPLLVPVMERGRRLSRESLERARGRCAEQRARLPEEHRRLDARPYEVEFSPALIALRERVAEEARRRHGLQATSPDT
jgi:nicotinate phosphoribosyltransferase